MGPAHGNGQIAHMQQQMGGPGVQGMQGMQAFNNMMMNQMPMLGMPAGMPEMPPHMMGNMAGKELFEFGVSKLLVKWWPSRCLLGTRILFLLCLKRVQGR